MKLLADSTEYKEFISFQKGKGTFSEEWLNVKDPDIFWESFSSTLPKLSNLALFCSSFSASAKVATERKSFKPLSEAKMSEKYKFVSQAL